MKGLIYVADDEEDIRNLIKDYLEKEGYEVYSFESGDSLIKKHLEHKPDLVVLDVMMPGTDGFSACAELRRTSDVPIILLTGRVSDADYITGFTMGCDDYFTKPFSPIKLVMRVNAIFKRIAMTTAEEDSLEMGDVILFPEKKSASCQGKELKLTNTEYKLLQYMLKEKEKAVSREILLNEVWGYTAEVETRVTDDTIKRLRKKLKEHGSSLSIETVYGFGFKLGIIE